MLAKEILVAEIPTLNTEDSIAQAIEWMDEFKVTHLAVVQNLKLLGLVHEDYLLDVEDPTDRIDQHLKHLIKAYIYEDEHVFQVVKRVEEYHLSIIPVLSTAGEFLGINTVANLMEMIADMPVVKSPGGIIILNISQNDYSMTEISRLVENSDARIIGAFITRNIDDNIFELTLKINKLNVESIAEMFEKFGYDIAASYDVGDDEDDVKDNYDNLMNYLNI